MARGLRELSSCRGPAFGFQHPQSGSQPTITPVPGDPIPFSCLLRHYIHVCTYTRRQNTKTHQQIRRKWFISNYIAYGGKVVRIKASSNTVSLSALQTPRWGPSTRVQTYRGCIRPRWIFSGKKTQVLLPLLFLCLVHISIFTGISLHL